MKIQLKRSNQLDGGSAKAPSIGYMEYGELAVNFNEADPCIFIKASDGAGSDSIVRIAGAGAESGGMPDGPTADRPSTPSTGDLYFDTDLNLIVYWDGSQWIPVSPGVITSDTAPTVSLYAAGTLWYNNDEAEGALYILYEDPAGPGANAGGKIWVQIAGSGGGGGSSVVVSDTPPNAANEGDLWFDSESGRLYIWYVNTNSQGQWIDASPEGPDETQVGDLKYDIANEDLQYWDGNAWVSIGGIGSSVTTEEPTDPSNGDLWWNTADNTLYIWYEDGDTGQWVISVPQGSGGGGDSGEYVSKTETASQNIVSDLTLGTDKITLDATTGGARFDGDVGIGGGSNFGSTPDYFAKQLNIYETGLGAVTGISFGGNASSNYIYAQNGTSSIDLAPENAVGIRVGPFAAGDFPNRVARFSNTSLEIGGTLEEDDAVIKGNIILRESGSASFTGTVDTGTIDISSNSGTGCEVRLDGLVRAQRPTGSSGSAVFQAWNGNFNSATITAGGSASFAGQVEVGNYNSGDSTSGGIVVKPTGQLVVQGYVGSKETPITAVQGYETASNGSISGSWEIKSDGNAYI